MDFSGQLRRYLRDEGEKLPWPLGQKDSLSDRAERVWCVLPLWRRLLVSRLNPYKRYRNEGLRGLNEEGIPYVVINEISGIPISTIERILGQKET